MVQQAPLSKDAVSAMAALRSSGLYAPAPWAAGAASTGATVCRERPADETSESHHRWVHPTLSPTVSPALLNLAHAASLGARVTCPGCRRVGQTCLSRGWNHLRPRLEQRPATSAWPNSAA